MRGLLTAADRLQMQLDLLDIIDDNEQSIVITRNEQSLPAQTVRIERRAGGGANQRDSMHAQETRGQIIIVGPNLDAQVDDYFNALGALFKVTHVRSNTQMGVMAEAQLIQ